MEGRTMPRPKGSNKPKPPVVAEFPVFDRTTNQICCESCRRENREDLKFKQLEALLTEKRDVA